MNSCGMAFHGLLFYWCCIICLGFQSKLHVCYTIYSSMYEFERGEVVHIRDFPFGKATRIHGKVVGILQNENYNILLTSGLNQGKIIKYKSYELIRRKEVPIEIRED